MKNKDIIIIGGGIAGISAGIYAQKNGWNTTIFEMHERLGGQLTSWDRNGYRFDYCLHWLVGTDHGVYHDIWKEVGAITPEVEIVNHRIFMKMEDERYGEFFIYNDLDEWESYLIDMAPEDRHGIEKLCKMMRKSDHLDAFEHPPEMRSFFDYIKAFVHMGSFFTILLKYGKRTGKELFDDLGINNRRLRYFIDKFFGGKDFSALGFLMMLGWAHANNAGYLKGGSKAMADRMTQKFCSLGGKIRAHAKVKHIIVDNNRAVGVKLANEEEFFADHIIGACDGHSLIFDMLKGKYVNEKLKEAYSNWELFTPLVLIGFGINDHIISEAHNTTYIKDGLSFGSTKTNAYSIMNRSMYDPHFAPKGKTVLLMQFESPWENWVTLSGMAYLEEKRAIRKVAVELLEEQYPGISEDIEVIDIATPLTTVRYTGVWKGAYEGFMPTKEVLNGLPLKLPGLDGFTMIGQWLFPGGGLPPSAQSGKWAIQMLMKEEKLAFSS